MPTRSCVVCRKKEEKANLLRVVTKEIDEKNIAFLDKTQKENKRAIYLCNDKDCIEKAIKMLEKRKFKTKIGINLESLEVLLNKIDKELGE